MASSVSGWASLPVELLDLVLDRVDEFPDFIRFCSVCQSWRSVALQPPPLDPQSQADRLRRQHHQNLHLLKTCQIQLPMLLTTAKGQDQDKRSLYSVTEGVYYDIQLPFPVPYYLRASQPFCGSSRGWLFTIDRYSRVHTLFNPFVNKTFSLPPLDVIPDDDPLYIFAIQKAVLQFDPDHVNYEVFVRVTETLAYFSSKNPTWVGIKAPPSFWVSDIISYKGRMYAVTANGDLKSVDFYQKKLNDVHALSLFKSHLAYSHLVESQEGDLLLVRRSTRRKGTRDPRIRIEVYKLLLPRGRQRRPKLARIHRIGEQALFLGDSCDSVSISTRDFPMCKPNFIYYDDHCFDISEERPQRGENCVELPYPSSLFSCMNAIWIVPYFKT